MSLHICLNPQNVHHQEWTLMLTIDFECLPCVSVSSVIINVPLSTFIGDVDNRGGYTCVGARGTEKVSVSSPRFCCDPKTALKNKVLEKDI